MFTLIIEYITIITIPPKATLVVSDCGAPCEPSVVLRGTAAQPIVIQGVGSAPRGDGNTKHRFIDMTATVTVTVIIYIYIYIYVYTLSLLVYIYIYIYIHAYICNTTATITTTTTTTTNHNNNNSNKYWARLWAGLAIGVQRRTGVNTTHIWRKTKVVLVKVAS